MTVIRRHAGLLAVLIAVQVTTCSLPFIAWFRYTPSIGRSWLADVAGNYSNVLVMFWVWLVAVIVIGTGAWWSDEVNEGFFLEVWRHRSYRAWLGSRLVFAMLTGAIVLGFGLVPFLFVAYEGQVGGVLAVAMAIALYTACLSLMLIAPTMLGVRVGFAVVGVLLFHTINVVFDGLGLPNMLRFFLFGEAASWESIAAVLAMLAAAAGVMLIASTPESLMRRGSESR